MDLDRYVASGEVMPLSYLPTPADTRAHERVRHGASLYVHALQESKDQLKQLLKTCIEVIEASDLVPGQVLTGYTFAAGSGAKVPMQEAGQIINNPTVAKTLLPTKKGSSLGAQITTSSTSKT